MQHLPSPPLTPHLVEIPSKLDLDAGICAMPNCPHVLSSPESRGGFCEPCQTRMKNEKTQKQVKVATTAETDHDAGSAIPDASRIQEQDNSSSDGSEDIPLASS